LAGLYHSSSEAGGVPRLTSESAATSFTGIVKSSENSKRTEMGFKFQVSRKVMIPNPGFRQKNSVENLLHAFIN
jgi:hypothetical protein